MGKIGDGGGRDCSLIGTRSQLEKPSLVVAVNLPRRQRWCVARRCCLMQNASPRSCCADQPAAER